MRSRGRIHFSRENVFLNTLNEVLGFIQAVESDGGNPHSAFYVAQNELEEIKINKKSLLSFYNNLIQGYHPSITIDGKSGASWYSLAAKAGETLAYNYDSSIRNLGPFDHRYIYNTETSHSSKWDDVTFQYIYTEHLQQSFTKVNLGALFTNSLRDILTGGSVSVSLATSDDQLLESHVSESGNLSALVKSFVPNARFFEFGEEKVVVPEQVS